jgi:hypothetical protein
MLAGRSDPDASSSSPPRRNPQARGLWPNTAPWKSLACDIPNIFPESKLGLESLEAGIQTTAKRLAVAANICAMSPEGLVDTLERYNAGVQILRPWQV